MGLQSLSDHSVTVLYENIRHQVEADRPHEYRLTSTPLIKQRDGGISYGLIQSLREKNINVVDYKPKGDKQERLICQIDLFEGGSVLLPKDAPWLEEFVSELLSFPGRHDDQVDALAQGLAWRRETWKAPLVQRRTFGSY